MAEPQTEFLRVVDPQTKGTIVCVNHHHIVSSKWRTKYLCNSNEDDENNIFDLSSHHPCGNKKSFNCSTVDMGAERPWVELLVDYACEMHRMLSNNGEVVVHCTTGIKGPTMILAFFLLRGLDRQHTMEWLTKAFQTQRPTVASSSVPFPNFGKFENILLALENSLQQPWLQSRIATNARFLSPSSSTTTSITFKQLHGEPWTKTLVVPNRTSASDLPTSSYCPPPVVVGRAIDDQKGSSTINRKKSARIHRKKNETETREKEEENFLAWSPMVGSRILVESTERKTDGTKEEGSVGTLVEKLAAAEWRVGACACLFLFFYYFYRSFLTLIKK